MINVNLVIRNAFGHKYLKMDTVNAHLAFIYKVVNANHAHINAKNA